MLTVSPRTHDLYEKSSLKISLLSEDPAKTKECQKNKNQQNREQNRTSKSMYELAKRRMRACRFKVYYEFRKTPPTGGAKQLLDMWNGCDMVSCNVVHACGRQEALPSA